MRDDEERDPEESVIVVMRARTTVKYAKDLETFLREACIEWFKQRGIDMEDRTEPEMGRANNPWDLGGLLPFNPIPFPFMRGQSQTPLFDALVRAMGQSPELFKTLEDMKESEETLLGTTSQRRKRRAKAKASTTPSVVPNDLRELFEGKKPTSEE